MVIWNYGFVVRRVFVICRNGVWLSEQCSIYGIDYLTMHDNQGDAFALGSWARPEASRNSNSIQNQKGDNARMIRREGCEGDGQRKGYMYTDLHWRCV